MSAEPYLTPIAQD